ncbi:hypothetical protein [Paenirhodobacter populi]|uniref:hypothetical protein n=1 Tax=Paenirhodobacter populi TaxID=2306993 RepID=UPI001F4DAB9C|nr:hypothetical protein [Sinirhodobacter populi]
MLRLPKRRKAYRNSTDTEIISAVRRFARLATDGLIAGILNRHGALTGHGNRWSRKWVTALRAHHKIPIFRKAVDGIEPWLNLTDATRLDWRDAKDTQACYRSGADRGGSSNTPRPMDLSPLRSHRTSRPADSISCQAELKISRRIELGSGKLIPFSHIERWVP